MHYQRLLKHGDTAQRTRKSGGNRNDELYSVYYNIIARCYNKKSHNYKYYGGRGIGVCDRWNKDGGFICFKEDMGERPVGYQIDRIDVNNDYSPENCRWVDKYTQMGNTRATKISSGVNWYPRRDKYRARIKVRGKDITLGYFDKLEKALRARKEAYKKYVI